MPSLISTLAHWCSDNLKTLKEHPSLLTPVSMATINFRRIRHLNWKDKGKAGIPAFKRVSVANTGLYPHRSTGLELTTLCSSWRFLTSALACSVCRLSSSDSSSHDALCFYSRKGLALSTKLWRWKNCFVFKRKTTGKCCAALLWCSLYRKNTMFILSSV